jgi:hypothetical protein
MVSQIAGHVRTMTYSSGKRDYQAQAIFAKTKVQRFADDEGLETFPD